jgi:tRNA dimethylallyltransferase
VDRKILYVVVGPTAVGKTALAIALARALQTEIVSADSRQVYREMNIGTAKPSLQELTTVKHHFINSHSIHDSYNAGQYARDAYPLILSLFEKYNQLVMVGGSGLYIKAALEGFDEIPEVPGSVREEIEKTYEEKGLSWLQQQMQLHDPELFARIDRQNPHRLIRALEVKLHTGQSIEHFRLKQRKENPFEIRWIGLELDREKLYQRIDARLDSMIEHGLFEEAGKLYPLKHLQALQTVGYQEVFDCIDGLYTKEEAIRLLKRNSRHYAKRQLTWFKRVESVQWFTAGQVDVTKLATP